MSAQADDVPVQVKDDARKVSTTSTGTTISSKMSQKKSLPGDKTDGTPSNSFVSMSSHLETHLLLPQAIAEESANEDNTSKSETAV